MGGGYSSNIAKVSAEAITKTATNIINNQKISNNQSQIISVHDVGHDVNISDINMDQKVDVNMDALLKAMVQTDVKTKMAQDLAQQAKSVVSGINLFQFTDANNTMEAYMKASIDISNNISQTCASTASQSQTIDVSNVDGNVNITDVTMNQMTDVFTKCVEDVFSNTSAVTDMQQKISQSATAESKGVSPWALVAMGIIALLFVAMPVIIGVNSIIKFMFPIIFVAGNILIYFFYSGF